ncbi:MAG: glycosyltransferase, partial [Candidatus Omnitrophota bacterium]
IVFASIRAMQEAKADLILFVDDDNILNPDYIEKGLAKAKEWPIIGAWGGQLLARFECEPPEWTKQFWDSLAIRELKRDLWSNLIYQYESTPPSAGMFLRRPVFMRYLDDVKVNPKKLFFGSWNGDFCIRCEDSDMAFTACDIGLGTARFKELILTHIMPKERLEEKYLLKFMENMFYSSKLFELSRGKALACIKKPAFSRLREKISVWRVSRTNRIFCLAERRGYARACKETNKVI